MYAGHFATGLALKAVRPATPTWALLTAAGLVDLVFGVAVMLGVEGTDPRPGVLDIPWTHSLAMGLVWAGMFAAPFMRAGWRTALILAIGVYSHLLLDLLSHAPDIRLWPMGETALGFRSIFGGVSGWGEGTIVLLGLSAYSWSARRNAGHGRHWPWAWVVVGVCWTLGLLT